LMIFLSWKGKGRNYLSLLNTHFLYTLRINCYRSSNIQYLYTFCEICITWLYYTCQCHCHYIAKSKV